MNKIDFIKKYCRYVLAFLIMVSYSAVYGQSKVITGTVLDDNSQPMPGVNVLEKGTTNGTMTDFDGNYSLKANQQSTLVFSFLGFTTQEIRVRDQNVVNVDLVTNTEALFEVVVVGYGTKNIRDVTGSIATVKTEELDRAPVANFDEALSGRMAGVYVTPTEGEPGQTGSIIIRGGNSITGDNRPLYVIDGVPMEDFDAGALSMNDIDTFDVLKDASATAIYGSRGANGVIMISTKRGKEGKASIMAKLESGVSWIPNTLPVMTPYDFVKLQEEVAYATGGDKVENFYKNWIDPELYKDVKGTNWQKEIFRMSLLKDYSVSMSGGSATTKFYTSFGLVDQEGTLLNTGFRKYNGSFRLDHALENVDLGLNVRYSNQRKYGAGARGVIEDAFSFRPVEPLVSDGLEDGIDLTEANLSRFNPVKTLRNTHKVNKSSDLRAVLTADIRISEKLKLMLKGAYAEGDNRDERFFGSETLKAKRYNNGVHGSLSDNRNYILSTSNVLTYDNTIDNHKFTGMLGYEYDIKSRESFTAGSKQIPFDGIGVDNLGLGVIADIPSSYKGKSSMLSYFTRLDYSYKGRYILSGSFRMDGSSRFQGDNKWGYFPAVSGAWRIIDEPFMRKLRKNKTLSELKLRAGWGVTGNNRVPDYATFNVLSSGVNSGYSYAGSYGPGYYVNDLADADLKWETTRQYNIGLDMAFMRNRLKVTVEAYQKNTDDLLLNAKVAPSSSFSSVWTNIGEVQNKGLETTIDFRNVKSKNFKWNTSFNISFNRNTVIKLTDGANELLTNPGWNNKVNEFQYASVVGQTVGKFYGLLSDGLYSVDDFVHVNNEGYVLKDDVADASGGAEQVIPGSMKYKDLDGNGIIDFNDRTVIGSPEPDFYGGFGNNLSWNNWDLSVFFNYSYGNEIFNMNKLEYETPTTKANYNYFSEVANRYSPTNPNGTINIVRGESAILGAPVPGNEVSNRLVEDGSFIKLKTVVISYRLPKLKMNGIEQVKLSLSAQNLYTWTNYSGYDPEVSVGRMGALSQGLDYSSYPASTTVTLGLNLSF
ncbi:SusC/RagA family TonB-linked outer membrane protein [Mariniflexile ostreae]|uniref:SusC/RagA family TonB-linked outer membrane protein n=1 Tax=Mariniflexile ostreae TaxID=1520892 RepID=A0ABV5FF64_9FLAO